MLRRPSGRRNFFSALQRGLPRTVAEHWQQQRDEAARDDALGRARKNRRRPRADLAQIEIVHVEIVHARPGIACVGQGIVSEESLCGGIIAGASGHGCNGQLYGAIFIQWVVIEAFP